MKCRKNNQHSYFVYIYTYMSQKTNNNLIEVENRKTTICWRKQNAQYKYEILPVYNKENI